PPVLTAIGRPPAPTETGKNACPTSMLLQNLGTRTKTWMECPLPFAENCTVLALFACRRGERQAICDGAPRHAKADHDGEPGASLGTLLASPELRGSVTALRKGYGL